MALEIREARFYDTVSDSAFGPVCASDKEAEILAYEIQRTEGVDARALEPALLAERLFDLRDGSMLSRETHASRACFCGSGKPWLSKLMQLGKPSATRCADCSGTEDKAAALVVARTLGVLP